MRDPLISVVIPVYNTAPYLERCIQSVAENTYKHLEIICVNDGSTDDSLEILERLAQHDDRIRIITQPNGGVSVARNNGIDASKGEYIFMVDADDQIHRNALEYLLCAARNSSADIVIGGYKHVYDETAWITDEACSYTGFRGPLGALAAFDQNGMLRDSIWGTLYRRDAIGTYRFFPNLSYGEDAYFNTLLRASRRNLTFAYVDLPLYYYFTRTGSLMQTTQIDKQLFAMKLWTAHIDDFENPGLAVCYILEQSFYYLMAGGKTAVPSVPRRNRRKMIRACIPYLGSLLKVGKKNIIKCLLCGLFPYVYLAILIWRDPTYRNYMQNLQRKYHGYIAKKWDEV